MLRRATILVEAESMWLASSDGLAERSQPSIQMDGKGTDERDGGKSQSERPTRRTSHEFPSCAVSEAWGDDDAGRFPAYRSSAVPTIQEIGATES